MRSGPLVAQRRREIPAAEYDRSFFLSPFLEGYQDYVASGLSVTKRKQVEMLALEPDMTVCEVGYGRGELIRECARRGARVAGIDYSPDAFAIACETLNGIPDGDLRIGDAREMPFPSASFDRTISGDVIEHMNFEDATCVLREMYRITKPGGFLLVHTTPNTVFTRWVYPWARVFLRLIDLEQVRWIDAHLELMRRYHIDEYNLPALRRLARAADLPRSDVWIDADVMRSYQHWHTRAFAANRVVQLAGALARFAPVRFLVGNDLYLRCWRV